MRQARVDIRGSSGKSRPSRGRSTGSEASEQSLAVFIREGLFRARFLALEFPGSMVSKVNEPPVQVERRAPGVESNAPNASHTKAFSHDNGSTEESAMVSRK